MFTAALSTIGKKWKQPKYPSIVEWIKKMWGVYTHARARTHTHTHTQMEYYSAMKKNETLPFALPSAKSIKKHK